MQQQPQMSQSAQQEIKALLEKTNHYDADERFMAVFDLNEKLKQYPKIDDGLQVSIRDAFLKLVDDGNGDVTTSAVKLLSQVVPKFSPENNTHIVDKLSAILVNTSRSASREVIAQSLKTVLAAVSAQSATAIIPKISATLLNGLRVEPTKENTDLHMFVLDTTKEFLERFGSTFAALPAPIANNPAPHAQMLDAMLSLLRHFDHNVSKRTSVTIGAFAPALPEASFSSLLDSLLSEIGKSQRKDRFIETIGFISRGAGARLGPYLDKLVPMLKTFLVPQNEPSAEQQELWEICLKALEALLMRCPRKMNETNLASQVFNMALEWISFDPLFEEQPSSPNPSGKSSMEDDDWGADGGDDWGADAGDGWGDDAAISAATTSDDLSWRVRRAAVNILSAYVKVAPSPALKERYMTLMKALIARFSERDLNVKEDVLIATRDLVQQSILTDSTQPQPVAEEKQESMSDEIPPQMPPLQRTPSLCAILGSNQQLVFLALETLFSTTEPRTVRAIFALVETLLNAHKSSPSPNEWKDFLPRLVPFITSSFAIKATEVQTDAIHLISSLCSVFPSDMLEPYVCSLAQAVASVIKSGDHKIVPEAMDAISHITPKLQISKPDHVQSASSLFSLVFAQMKLNDVPSEIKLSSMKAASSLLSFAAPVDNLMAKELQEALTVYIDRLTNDATSHGSLRALRKIASKCQPGSNNANLLSLVLDKSADVLCSLLKKQPAQQGHDAIRLLEALAKVCPKSFCSKLSTIITETSACLNGTDSTMAHYVLSFLSTLLSTNSSDEVLKVYAAHVVPRAIQYLQNPLLQGQALQSSIVFFAQVAKASAQSSVRETQPPQLVSSLLSQANIDSQSFHTVCTIAQSVAAVVSQTSQAQQSESVSRFLKDIPEAKSSSSQVVSLLVVGELGKMIDLSTLLPESASQNLIPNLLKTKLAQSGAASAQKTLMDAIAFCLGNICVSGMTKFLPILLDLLKKAQGSKYILFASIKNLILSLCSSPSSSCLVSALASFFDDIVSLCKSETGSQDVSVQAEISEIFGRLCALRPDKLLPVLEECSKSKCVSTRASVAVALRFALASSSSLPALVSRLSHFFSALIKDNDLEVQKQTILSLTSFVRSSPELVTPEFFIPLLPTLLHLTAVDKSLCHEEDYGNFKTIVDDGKPRRLTTFQCLSAVLDGAPQLLDVKQVLEHVVKGFTDDSDIQLLTCNMLTRLARSHADDVVGTLAKLPPLLMSSFKAHIQAAKKEDTKEASMQALKTYIVMMVTLLRIPAAEKVNEFVHFWHQIKATALLQPIIKEVTEGPAPSSSSA